jgi:hypothetical protein
MALIFDDTAKLGMDRAPLLLANLDYDNIVFLTDSPTRDGC